MATELLTCDACGTDWVRRIARGSGPAPARCPDCAAAAPPVAVAPTASLGLATGQLAPRNDRDLEVAFDSIPVNELIGYAVALCLDCYGTWTAGQSQPTCSVCGSSRGRVLVTGDVRPNGTPDPRPGMRPTSTTGTLGPPATHRNPDGWAGPPDDVDAAPPAADVSDDALSGLVAAATPGDPFAALDIADATRQTVHHTDAATTSMGYDPTWVDSLHVQTCLICTRSYLDHPARSTWNLCPQCDTGHVADRRSRHGLRVAVRDSCRCDECLSAVSRVRDWVRRRINGETLQAIGADAGISRERIRQTIRILEPHEPWDAATRALKHQLDEEGRVAAEAHEQARREKHGPCPVCGGDLPAGRPRFCSNDCAHRWSVLRLHIDDQRRESHRKLMARWAVDNPDLVRDFQLRHAQRVLDGTAEIIEERRWLIEGSEPFKVAVEAVVNGWPLAGLLPDPVRRQIDTHLGRAVTDWTDVLTEEVLVDEYVEQRQPPSVIATKFGCSTDDVYEALERHGVVLRTPGGSPARSGYDDVLTREFLGREYVEAGRSAIDIADDVGCHPSTVYSALHRHGIDTRSRTKRRSRYGDVLNREFLQQEYVHKGKSGTQIAEDVGCGKHAVYAALRRHGIPVRDIAPVASYDDVLTSEFLCREYVEAGRSGTDIADDVGCSRHTVYAALRHHGLEPRGGGTGRESWAEVLTEDFLRREYVDAGKSGNRIAEEVGCSPSIVYAWIDRHGIETRPTTTYERDLPYTEEWLREQYLNEGRPALELADEVGLSVPGLYAALRKFGIRRSEQPNRSHLTRGLLEREYVDRRRDVRDIAAEVGVDKSTVYAALRRQGIELRE
jgi:DNA-binding phage protein/transposase-like protein/predicted nucleic acid-binding Zn ribbon protein